MRRAGVVAARRGRSELEEGVGGEYGARVTELTTVEVAGTTAALNRERMCCRIHWSRDIEESHRSGWRDGTRIQLATEAHMRRTSGQWRNKWETVFQNITCCANQTQTERRRSFSGPTSPPSGAVKEKVKGPKLDDGGVGFPPFRFGGGGGGGGGGGSSSFGGFILFVIVLLLDYLREFERNLQNGPRRSSGYDNGLASY